MKDATVSYFTEAYLNSLGRDDYNSSYRNQTLRMQMLNAKFHIAPTDYDLAKILISIPLSEKYDWFEEQVIEAAKGANFTVNELKELQEFVEMVRVIE